MDSSPAVAVQYAGFCRQVLDAESMLWMSRPERGPVCRTAKDALPPQPERKTTLRARNLARPTTVQTPETIRIHLNGWTALGLVKGHLEVDAKICQRMH